VNTEFSLATIGKRTVAALIDSLVLTLFVFVLYYEPLKALTDLFQEATTPQSQSDFLEAFQAFQHETLPYILALNVVYHAVLVWQTGMTLGKYILKIKVVTTDDKNSLSFFDALVRALLRTVGELIVFYITFLPAWFTPLRQTLHDRLGKTVVVNLEAAT
jgi:uncharacterized RDD family membrane protein YckC